MARSIRAVQGDEGIRGIVRSVQDGGLVIECADARRAPEGGRMLSWIDLSLYQIVLQPETNGAECGLVAEVRKKAQEDTIAECRNSLAMAMASKNCDSPGEFRGWTWDSLLNYLKVKLAEVAGLDEQLNKVSNTLGAKARESALHAAYRVVHKLQSVTSFSSLVARRLKEKSDAMDLAIVQRGELKATLAELEAQVKSAERWEADVRHVLGIQGEPTVLGIQRAARELSRLSDQEHALRHELGAGSMESAMDRAGILFAGPGAEPWRFAREPDG